MSTILTGYLFQDCMYVASTKTSPISRVIDSSIYSCVLFVGLDSNSSRFELLAVDHHQYW